MTAGRAKCMTSVNVQSIGRTAATDRTSQPDGSVGQGFGKVVGAGVIGRPP